MARYLVSVREVQIVFVEVEADSEKDAIEKVDANGYDTSGGTEFSHTLETEFWTAEKLEEEDGKKTTEPK